MEFDSNYLNHNFEPTIHLKIGQEIWYDCKKCNVTIMFDKYCELHLKQGYIFFLGDNLIISNEQFTCEEIIIKNIIE